MAGSALPLPFGPGSGTGFELELLAPEGKTRFDLALAIADGDASRLRYGFKYYHLGDFDDRRRPLCRLTPAYRVLDPDGATLLTVVDDPTIRAQLRPGLEPGPGTSARTDDIRLAKWIEARCWSTGEGLMARLQALAEVFDGRWTDGDPPALVDPYGYPLVRAAPEQVEALRVCEVVTRPLGRDERGPVVRTLLERARALGCIVPTEGAYHLHLDRAPWLSTGRLAALLLRAHEEVPRLKRELGTGRGPTRLGPFPPAALQVAREASTQVPFGVFAAALVLAGVDKYCDLNVLGAVEEFPVHPTIEVRFLPATLDAQLLMSHVERIERFLLEVARDSAAE